MLDKARSARARPKGADDVTNPLEGVTVSIKLTQLDTVTRAIRKLTTEVHRMANELDDLRTEVAAENAEDLVTSKTIADQQATIADLQAKIDATQPLIDGAKAGEAAALEQLDEALTGIREAVTALAADNTPDPQPEP